jgi:hypothetical protein
VSSACLVLTSSSSELTYTSLHAICPLGAISAILCVVWFMYSEHISWVWLVQDFLGVSVCMLFLSSVHLPNLRAATMLLGDGMECHVMSCNIAVVLSYISYGHMTPPQRLSVFEAFSVKVLCTS